MKKNTRGFTLVEVVVSVCVLALIMTGLTYVFVAAKKQLRHAHSKMRAVELGRFFLAPLQMDVRQDTWDSGTTCLRSGTNCPEAQTIDSVTYTPTYGGEGSATAPTSDAPIVNLQKVKLKITWSEPSS